MIGYYRVLQRVKCTECGFEDYDANCEQYDFTVDFPSVHRVHVRMKCHGCGKMDVMEFLNSENTESVSGSCSESGVLHAVRDRNANGEDLPKELEPVAEALEIRTDTERVLNCQNYINDMQLIPCEQACVNCKYYKNP